MKSNSTIAELIATAKESMVADCKDLATNKINVKGSVAEVEANIADFIEKTIKVINGVSIKLKDAYIPKFLSDWKLTLSEDGQSIDYITLTIKSKLKAKYQVRDSKVIYLDENLEENICNTVIDTVMSLFYLDLAEENIEAFKNRIAEIIIEKGYELPFDIDFAVSNCPIVEISDNSITLGVGLDNAFKLSSSIVFDRRELEEGEKDYKDYLAREAEETFIEELSAVQTPVQLVKANISLFVCLSPRTKRSVSSMIREICHKQAKYLTSKEGIGYVQEKVTIDGEEKEIFALVKKEMAFTDGKLEEESSEVVLSAFDKKTLETVDVDVLPYAKYVAPAPTVA